MPYDTEFPLTNLDIINNGTCRFCPFAKSITNTNDIKELQNHYKANHVVKFYKLPAPEMSQLVQEENSMDPSKNFLDVLCFQKSYFDTQY